MVSGRQARAVGGVASLYVVLAGLAVLYASFGGGGRDRQVALLFIYITIVVALQTFVGNSGVFSLGHIGIGGIGAYTAAILAALPTVKDIAIPNAPLGLAGVQLPMLAAVALGVLVATAVAAVVGLPIARLNGLAALIVTLAFLVIVNTTLTNWTSMTGGAEAFYGFPTIDGFVWPMAAAFLAMVVAALYRRSTAGIRLQASREDELAAEAAGVAVARARYTAWLLSGALVALGGILLAFFVGATNPNEYFLHLTLLTIAMLVLGGMRSVMGAALGAVVILIGTEVTRFLGDGPVVVGVQLPKLFGLSTLFLGGVILVTMLLRPEGLVGDTEAEDLIARILRRFRRRQETPATAAVSIAGEADDRQRPSLQVRNVSMFFSGLHALQDVDLDVAPGEIVGLIGPNGAGKTTLLNTISGVLQPTAGEIRLGDRALVARGPTRVARMGVARTFQNIRLFKDLGVRENVEVAAATAARYRRDVPGPSVPELLNGLGLHGDAVRRASTLSYGAQREVEMARAAALAPDLLLLDEPAAGMNTAETQELLGRVRSLRDRLGCAVIVVDHDLHFIMALCDRVYVLNSGMLIASGEPAHVQRDPAVIAAYLGNRAQSHPPAGVDPEPDSGTAEHVPASPTDRATTEADT